MLDNSGLLIESWYAAALGSTIKRTPTKCRLFNTDLVIWRDKNGVVAVFEDRCCHRNAPLSAGTIVDNCIVCPYHSWTFDAEGKCTNIPSEGPSFKETNRWRVKVFPSLEKDGLVWVWMGKTSPSGQPLDMPYWGSPNWHTYYMETIFENNVTNLIENFMDIPHTVSVHRGWFRSKKKLAVQATVHASNTGVFVTYQQPEDSIGITGFLLNPLNRPLDHTDHFIFPNHTRVDYIFGNDGGGLVITSTCSPISEYQTKVYTLISHQTRFFGPLLKWILPWYTRKVIGQDVQIMALQKSVISHVGSQHNMSSPVDLMHVYIERMRHYATIGQPQDELESFEKDITFWI